MRLIASILFICAVGCANDVDQPPDYPQPVDEGTFVGFDTYGQMTPHLALVYADKTNHVRTLDLDGTVITPQPLYPGNHIVITQTDPKSFTITKEE